ncbi:MAG: hypothetical protein J7605_20670 [Variovorax sp.]|nr:hypothetical protein [Variovorax sp.]
MQFDIGKEMTMALDLLRRIAGSPLPMSFTQTADIDRVRILRAAGLVVAFVPEAHHPSIAMLLQRPAQVVGITQKGRAELTQANLSKTALSRST